MRLKLLLKTTALSTLLLFAGITSWGQTTVNLDNAANWIQDGSISFTSYGNHAYSESGALIQGTNVVRNATAAQDGFPGANGTYSMRVGNTATSKATITVATGGISTFSFKVRRWDNSPMPSYTVKYSTDGGSNWTSLTNIDGTLLTTSDWFTYNGTINNAKPSIIIQIANTGTTERIMIDDFTWTGYTDTTAPIATWSPINLATGVYIYSNITITYNEAIRNIDNSAIDNSNIASLLGLKLTNSSGASVAFIATIDAAKKVITINPDANLLGNQVYYVSIAPIEDEFNNATAPESITFTTIDASTPVISNVAITEASPYYAGANITVTWSSANVDFVKIEAWVPSSSTWEVMSASSDATDGSEVVTIPADAMYSTAYKVRVSYVTTPSVNSESATVTVIATPSINAIQSNRSDGDKSIYNGSVVKISGIVIAKMTSTGYFVQSGIGANNGIYVYGAASAVAVGDNVSIVGTISEYQSGTPLFITEMVPTSVIVNSNGNTLPNATTITTGQFLTANVTSEPYEGVFIKMVNASVVSSTTIDDGSGVATLGTELSTFTLPAIGSKVTVTGLGYYSTTLGYKILPRSAADIQSSVASITSTTYTIDQGTGVISNVPYTVDVTTFKSKLTKATGSTYNVYDADGTTPATIINDTKKVIVISEDGLFTKTYTITRNAASTDATLSNLTSDGTQVPSFLPATLTYNVALPYGTLATAIPTVVATKADANAVVIIAYATDLAGNAAARTTTITVTAEDASTVKVYTIVYSITPANTDNTLSQIKVDGNAIVEFLPATTAYFVELPVGTTLVPTVTATTNHITANAVITPAVNVTGSQAERTATIVVTAQDLSTKTYTVEFSVAIPGTDATLSDLKIDGVTVTGFAALTTNYLVGLDAGTTIVPTVTVTTNDAAATKVITPAANVTGTLAERTTTIVVTAENTTTTKTYTVVFFVKSGDATLSNLTYNGTQVPAFDAATLNYNVELLHNTTVVPTVVGTKNNANATVIVTPATDLAGDAAARTTTILVTAEDDSYTKTYTIVFSVAKDTDAKLTGITYDGAAVPSFSSETLNYFVTLTFGTTVVPVVAVTKSDVNANAVIVQAANLTGTLAERTATITVTAEDGIASKVYTIVFRVDNVLKELFFSEYIEGSSNNKAFEIYNPFSVAVDLSTYNVRSSHDGAGWGTVGSDYYLTFAAGTMIAPGDAYVVSTDFTGIINYGDLKLTYGVGTGSKVVYFTGNDALGLFKGNTLVDVFGDVNSAATFDVAETVGAAVDHSIVRKPSVHAGNTNWATSAGTTIANSEWIVNGIDIFTNLGTHNINPTDPAITTNATTLADFGSIVQGTVGVVEGTFNVSGSLLSDNIIITAPAGFEISKLSGTNFVSEGPITLVPASGSVAVTPIYVKFHPAAVQAYSGNITITSVGVPDKAIAVTGTGIAADNTPPAFISGYPVSANVEPYKFDVKFKTDEAGKVYIVKQASGTAAPTNTEVFTDPAAVIVSVTANTEFSSTFTGLTMNTAYDMYLVAGDNQATTNLSGVVKLTVTTLNVPTKTIYQIQFTADPSGDSPEMNNWVSTTGIVTAIKGTTSFWIQSGTGAWNGMYVYSPTTVSLGDNVTVTGKVIESYKVTEFSAPVVTINNSGNTVPAAVEVTALAASSEMYEGVFVKVKRATCASGSAGSFVVNDGTGNLTVYKGIFATLALTINNKYDISGIIDYYNTGTMYELYPRNAGDISDVTGINDNSTLNVKVFPNPFTDVIRFEGVENIKRVIITNITGQVVKNEIIGQINSINTTELTQGMYFVTFMNDKGEKSTLKLIKQ